MSIAGETSQFGMGISLGWSLASGPGLAIIFALCSSSYLLGHDTNMVELRHGMRKKNHTKWS